ncbi:pyridoxal phosphate-dependent transferase [Xylaria sp. FL1777]|nr:pyridoxal phosphate-dependent transferase [Xylaria sp. FL1777]
MASHVASRVRKIASPSYYISDCTSLELSPTTLNLRTAENWVIRDELTEIYRKEVQKHLVPSTLSYGQGLGGDPELLKVTADLFNTYFNPADPLVPDDIVFTTGASLCLDALMFSLCDQGDEVLITAPYWNGFDTHLVMRTGVKLLPIHAPSADIGITAPEDLLKGSLVPSLQQAYESSSDPSRVKALVMTNPHNPYGRFYPESVIREAMLWCAERDIHYVSDEIYALSQLTPPGEHLRQDSALSQEKHGHQKIGEEPGEIPFVSALSIKFGDDKAPEISVVWGTSKDFGSSGLRVGVYIHRPQSSAAASRRVTTAGGVPASSTSVPTPRERSPLAISVANLTTSHLPTLTTSVLTKGLFLSPSFHDLLILSRTRLYENYVVLRSYLQEWGVPYVEVQGAPFVFTRLGCAVKQFRMAEARGIGNRELGVGARGELYSCSWDDEQYLVQTLLGERAGVSVAPGRQFHVAQETDSGTSGGNDGDGEPDNKRAGWVRITFAVPRPTLIEAILRIQTPEAVERIA